MASSDTSGSPDSSEEPLNGKTVLVTGANSGIGYQTALGLAAMGTRVGLVCRNRAKGEVAQEKIKSLTDNTAVDLFIADLGSQAEIAQLKKTTPDDRILLQLRTDFEASKKQLGSMRLTAAQDLAWALINSPAFLFNH